MENRGETLIIVPYWWDGSASRYFSKAIFNKSKLTMILGIVCKQLHISKGQICSKSGLKVSLSL